MAIVLRPLVEHLIQAPCQTHSRQGLITGAAHNRWLTWATSSSASSAVTWVVSCLARDRIVTVFNLESVVVAFLGAVELSPRMFSGRRLRAWLTPD